MTHIYTGIEKKDLFIIVKGRGTADYCSELNTYLQEILSKFSIERLLFDTQEADYLDSSFIGLILAMKKKMSKFEDHVFLLNPNKKISEIFNIMGLDHFVPTICDKNILCLECTLEIKRKLENSISDIKLLLESHQHIMATSKENYKRFSLVEKVFQKELEKYNNTSH